MIKIHHTHTIDTNTVRWLDHLLNTLTHKTERLMSAISDYAAKVTAFQNQISTALDDIKTEIGTLNDKITQLQNSPGAVTPEDQALLDAAQSQSQQLVAKAQALDTINPPSPPTGA